MKASVARAQQREDQEERGSESGQVLGHYKPFKSCSFYSKMRSGVTMGAHQRLSRRGIPWPDLGKQDHQDAKPRTD